MVLPDGAVVVSRRVHAGNRYGGAATKSGLHAPKVAEGTTVVISKDTAEKPSLLSARLRKRSICKEDGQNASLIKWFCLYNPCKERTFTQLQITDILNTISARKSQFNRDLVKTFAEVVRNFFKSNRATSITVAIEAEGHFPMNTDVGIFFRVRVSNSVFVVPASVFGSKKR